jgi:PAS domain S-box-containing protein
VRDTGQSIEFRAKPFQFADQPERGITYWDWTLVPVKSANGTVLGLVLSLLDVTENKRAEEALRASEERYRLLVETMNEGLAILNQASVITYVNDAFCRMMGYGRDELLGRTYLEFLSPDLLELHKDEMTRRRRGEFGRFETVLARKDGGKISVLVSGNPIFHDNGDFGGSFAIFTDITALKQAEQALRASKDELERIVAERTRELRLANTRLRSMTHDIVSTQEEERRRVARELHDEAGQALTALKLGLQMMRDELSWESTAHRRQMDAAVSLTDKTHEQIRILAQGLRPPALDSAGLDATLKGLCSEFAQRTQIQIDYTGFQVQALGPVAICLYRLLQEALTNAARHGRATHIHVRLQRDAEQVCLSVEDNGVGFDPTAVLENQADPKGMGLVGIQERLKMVDGWLEIHSKPGQGAQLIAHVPLEET